MALLRRMSQSPNTWRATKYGSYWRHVEDGAGVTVFLSEYPDTGKHPVWKWVYEGEYHGEWDTVEEAQEDAELELDLES